MERLIDFLNHSHLPFTGRDQEIDNILRFWRGTFDAQELRATLLLGEAGVGKSRLVDETVPRIVEAGGTVIHARLFPESATSIVPLVAQGLLYSDAARRLLRSGPEQTLASVVGSLRRVARLRPTLLIIEDIHLLAGDAVRELASLLEALSEESLALLATARPVELHARATLERFLVNEIALSGLTPSAVEDLWRTIFDTAADHDLVSQLAAATAGNPLAIRSAIRSAIRTRMIEQDPVSSAWRRSTGVDELGRLFHGSVELLAEGMTATLSEEERRIASTLASLGEVFGLETAEILVSDAAALLRPLIFKGIIVRPTTTPAALPGRPASTTPLAFTHTLVHQRLAEAGGAPVAGLVAAIAAGVPLYSITPFRILAAASLPSSFADVDVARAIEQMCAIALRLEEGPDWRLAREVIAAGWNLLPALEGVMPQDRATRLRLVLLSRDLISLRREIRSDAFTARLDQMLALTADPVDAELAGHRLRALRYRHIVMATVDYERCHEVWQEVEALIERWPEIGRDEIYLEYLNEAARIALNLPDVAMLRRVEERLDRLMQDPELPEPSRRFARLRVAPKFLPLFDTAEELARRMALLEELPRELDGINATNVMNRIALLESTGRMEEVLAEVRMVIDGLRAIGLQRNVATCSLISLCARAALGLELDDVEKEMARILSGGGYASSEEFRRTACIYLTEIGILRGAHAWTRRVQAEMRPEEPLYWREGDLVLRIAEGRLSECADQLDRSDDTERHLATLAARVTGAPDTEVTAGEAESAALRLLERPILRLENLLPLHATLALIAAAGRKTFSSTVRGRAKRALAEALAWAAERRLHPIALPLLDLHPGHLTRKEEQAWRVRIARLSEERKHAMGTSRVQVRIFGTISVGLNGEEPTPLRGARLRVLLALLVASRVVRTPLTHREFCSLAAGGETDPDLARKTANMAVIRLREAIGADAVVTGDETYALNLDHVDVDLLQAYHLLDDVRDALRRRSLVKAVQGVAGALDIVRGEISFPGLYEDFFEALRNDFEFRLRSAVVDVARALMWESDMASAVDLLRRAFEAIHDDEEIGELLSEALAAIGSHADAKRIRMKVETEIDL
jgi:hypothetical protein